MRSHSHLDSEFARTHGPFDVIVQLLEPRLEITCQKPSSLTSKMRVGVGMPRAPPSCRSVMDVAHRGFRVRQDASLTERSVW
jgi:hypothetical protein